MSGVIVVMNHVFIQASSYILGYMRKVILALDFPKIPSNHGLMIFFPLLSIFIKTFFLILDITTQICSLLLLCYHPSQIPI